MVGYISATTEETLHGVSSNPSARTPNSVPPRNQTTQTPSDPNLSSRLARSLQQMDSGLSARFAQNSGKEASLRFASDKRPNAEFQPAQQNPVRNVPRSPLSRPNGVTAIYRVRSSGTRAEGFVANNKKSSVLVRNTPASHAASANAAVPTIRRPPRTTISRAIPRPASVVARGVQGLVAAKSDALSPHSPAKLLETGFGNFLKGQVAAHTLFRFYGQVLLPLPQKLASWPLNPSTILQVKVNAAFVQVLYPYFNRNRHVQPLRSFFRMVFKGLMRRTGASGNTERYFLRKLLRRRLRNRWLHKMNKKKVRCISTNISRAAGRTKTADLKDFY